MKRNELELHMPQSAALEAWPLDRRKIVIEQLARQLLNCIEDEERAPAAWEEESVSSALIFVRMGNYVGALNALSAAFIPVRALASINSYRPRRSMTDLRADLAFTMRHPVRSASGQCLAN